MDELLEATTLTYIQKVGAFDTIAIINGILSGQTSYPAMAWQHGHFRDSVRLVVPRAAELMDDGTPGDL